MGKRPITSDGNGAYIIQKGTFGFIMVVVALITLLASAITYGATMRSDVDHLKEECSNNKQSLDTQDDRIDTLEETYPVINQRLKNIEESIKRLEETPK